MDLINKKCAPCEGGVPPLTLEQAMELMQQISGWNLEEGKRIRKIYTFKDFKEAMQFVNRVADIAESEGHHPDISIRGTKSR